MNRRLLTKYLVSLPFINWMKTSGSENNLIDIKNQDRMIEVCPGEFFEVPSNWDIVYAKSTPYYNGSQVEYDALRFFELFTGGYKYAVEAVKSKSLESFIRDFNIMQGYPRIQRRLIMIDGYHIGMVITRSEDDSVAMMRGTKE